MKRLATLIKKNFRLILRSKSSAAMVIIGPLLLIILLGAAFNTASIYGIRVGTYSENYSPLSEAVIYELNQESFATQKVDSEKSCIDGVRNSIFHVCAVFPDNLKVAQGGEIQFYVDNTKTNIIYLITETIAAEIGKKSEDLSLQLTKGVVDTLGDIKEEIEDRESLLNEIKTKGQENQVILSSLSTNVNEMNLDYQKSDIPLGTLQAQVSGDAANTFKAVENKIDLIMADVDKAASKQASILKQVATLNQNAETSEFATIQVEKTFTNIKKDISSVKETGTGKIVNPISSSINPITAKKTHLNFIFPTLLIMIMMFVSLLLTSTLEIRERTSKVYFKNFITPTSGFLFTISNYITNLLIVGLQAVVLLGAAAYLFYANIASTLHILLPVLLLITSIFLFMGICLGSIFKNEETNTITALSLGFIMVFFSSAILPIETLPAIIKNIAMFNPFYIGETILNKIILFQAPLKNVMKEIFLLSGYFIGVVIITGIVKKAMGKKD